MELQAIVLVAGAVGGLMPEQTQFQVQHTSSARSYQSHAEEMEETYLAVLQQGKMESMECEVFVLKDDQQQVR